TEPGVLDVLLLAQATVDGRADAANRRPDQVGDQVDVVEQVGQDPATGLGERVAPGRPVLADAGVVDHAERVERDDDRPANRAGGDDRLDAVVIPEVVVNHGEPGARAQAGRDHPGGVGRRVGDWLLAEHVIAGLGGGQDELRVEALWAGDGDGVDVG